MTYTTITTEGGLLPADILDAIAAEELPGQRAEDFGLEKSRRLGDEIAAAWGDIRVFWDGFQRGLRRLRESDTATSITREQWMIPFLRALGYELKYLQSAAVVEGRTYAISHRAGQHDDAPPVHIEGIRTSLDARPPTGRPRLSPHALLQEYLNSTEHVWGIVTNGERLRLLRDSSRMTRPAYVEFDLRAMLEGEKFSEFALLYRLLHRSRLPHSMEDATTCLLERYHQQAVEAGGRVREKLRDGVEQALKLLGNGVLQHRANAALRAKFAAGTITPLEFYRQLLRLVYRLLFLMVAEERNLIAAEEDVADPLSPLAYRPSANDRLEIYRQHYSIARLRRMAEQRSVGRGPYDDLWLGLMQTFQLLEGSDETHPRMLGLAALDGDLFSAQAIGDLEGTRVRNADLLQAIAALSLYSEKESKTLRRVNYAALDVEELGSVYESLLDFRPVVQALTPGPSPAAAGEGRFAFDLVTGTERKTTGSYYTRPELVHELIKSALDPVIEERLKAATTDHRPPTTGQRTSSSDADRRSSVVGRQSSAQEQALLSIRVCDPAAGSGHFLLAAARRIGRALAKARSGEEQPTPTEFRRAVRDVIQHCIYGVDLNPLAVDLCKLALWIEGHNAGMPLSFLDHHIKQGNSLIGATRALVEAGIPDDAYKAVTGDDKATASAIKKKNKGEREGFEKTRHVQEDMFGQSQAQAHGHALAAELDRLDALDENSVAAVRAKAARYRKLRDEGEAEWTRFNLWTAAFFQPLTPENARFVPTTKDLLDHQRRPKDLTDPKVAMAMVQAGEVGFFHWELEFPPVFGNRSPKAMNRNVMLSEAKHLNVASSNIGEMLHSVQHDNERPGGFDVVLGNPPWERIKLQEQEHWVDVPEIRDAANKAAREKAIQAWRASDDLAKRTRVALFDAAKYRAEAESRFVRASWRFPLTAVGDVNTYALFAEHARDLLAPVGRAGIIVPTGIATDDTTKEFFGDVVRKQNLFKLLGFINEDSLFPGVLHNFKFCTLTISGRSLAESKPDFSFLCHNFTHTTQIERHFSLSIIDFTLLNPNTGTCPIFRTYVDADLTRRIYQCNSVLFNEKSRKATWCVKFLTMFHMSGDSGLFLKDSKFSRVPLYEGKMIHQFDHRFASYETLDGRSHMLPEVSLNQHLNPDYRVHPSYYISQEEVAKRLSDLTPRNWFIGFRDVTSSGLARTAIFSVLPYCGVGHTMPLVFLEDHTMRQTVCFVTITNSLVFDYLVKQKIGGTHLTYGILNQLPVLPPSAFSEADIAFIVPRVLELVYTAWDMRPFAEDVWVESGTAEGRKERNDAGGDRNEIHDVGADRRIRPQRTAMPGDAGGHDDDGTNDVGADRRIRPQRTAMPGDAGDETNENDDVGADRRIRPRRTAAPGDAGAGHAERDDTDDPRRTTTPGDVGGDVVDIHDVGAKHSPPSTDADRGLRANASPLRHTSDTWRTSPASPASPASPTPDTLTPLQSEILRRNTECNADAPKDLFAPRDGFPLPPFRWSDERRAHIRAELDARIAHLYGLTRDELRYILDPADVYGPDFPGETFRVLKEKETRLYGEYRTRRLVLEAWDREHAIHE